MRKFHTITAAATLLAASAAHGAANSNSCMLKGCAAGDKAVTYTSKTEPYFACPTRELSDYTLFVIGSVAFSAELSGKMPELSPVTGEPIYQGKTAEMMTTLRNAARVRTFDEAAAMCKRGRNKVRVTILDAESGRSGSARVREEKTGETYWLPVSSLDKTSK
ncbi:hypothetical protein [Burkholderia multivorans]|uniref:hypothetical protein n=1 Tax=Burkholderia multivorans TaxID=87883 RepID=UPI0021C1BBC9|nr:hypothetical protein [Burkholderia multivorans]